MCTLLFSKCCLSKKSGVTLFRRFLCIQAMPEGPPLKKMCTVKKIGTHNGTFHCDEVLACYLLKTLPEYKDAEIVRTRDQEKLSSCDIVVDVGGVFDPALHRYDHHQRTFTETMNSLNPKKKWTTKLSSAGLVYYHFGRQILAQMLQTSQDDAFTELIFDKVYTEFVEEIDAVDNGISQTDGVPRYRVTTTLSSRVGGLNPSWNQTDVDADELFGKAMNMVGEEFKDRVNYFSKVWWPARSLVVEALNKRFEVDPSGEIVKFDNGGCPWKSHLFDLEEEMNISPTIKYFLYADQNGNWRVHSVPVRPDSFECRLPLYEPWRGIRDQALSDLSGIPDCIFVHASGFIGGNKTYKGALEMARKTLQAVKKASTT